MWDLQILIVRISFEGVDIDDVVCIYMDGVRPVLINLYDKALQVLVEVKIRTVKAVENVIEGMTIRITVIDDVLQGIGVRVNDRKEDGIDDVRIVINNEVVFYTVFSIPKVDLQGGLVIGMVLVIIVDEGFEI